MAFPLRSLSLLSAALMFAVAVTALPVPDGELAENGPTADYRLPDSAVPIHYNIEITPHLDEDEFTFDGEIAASVAIRRATRSLSLHALNLTIDEEATSLLDSNGVARTPATHDYDNLTEILTLAFGDELPRGVYVLSMKFAGLLHDDLYGFHRVSYVNEEGDTVWLAATQFEPTWARRAFPCWDEPALKATFNISIKHQRDRHTAISNMPIQEQTADDGLGDMVWTRFRKTPVMSTYLVAFVVVSDYVRVPNADGTVNVWTRPELTPYSKLAQNVAERARQLLTCYTNSTDRMPKIDNLAIQKLSSGAMENWGLIIYKEDSFAYNEELHTTTRKQTVAMTVAHELAHQWFGNVVSLLWWDQIWLKEGFASFLAYRVVDQIFENWRFMETFVTEVHMYALDVDIAENMEPVVLKVIKPKGTPMTVFTNYLKAPAIVRMLQHIVTDEVFRNGVIRYLNTHQFGSATSDDLWNALQEALDESDVPHNDYELKVVMDTWTTQRHFPMVHVTRKYDTGETVLTQEHFRPVDGDNKWWIPVTFATQTNPNFTNTMPSHWLSPQRNLTIDGIDPADWIVVNVQHTGYYRVNYDAENWRRIAQHLKSDNYTSVHVLNRAQIIDDAYHLFMTSQLDATTFLDLVTYLSHETDFIAWQPVFDVLRRAVNVHRYPGNEFLQPLIVEILGKLVENVGYEEDPDEDNLTKLKRISALELACNFGHAECKRMASVKLSEHLADPETHKIPPNLKKWTFYNGAMQANASTWNALFDKYTEEQDIDILVYLAYFEDPDIIVNYLNILLRNDTLTLDDEQFYTVYYSILDEHADNEFILDYMLANMDKMISRSFSAQHAFGSIINSVYSNDKLDKIGGVAETDFHEEYEKVIKNMIDERKSHLSDKFATLRPYIWQDKRR